MSNPETYTNIQEKNILEHRIQEKDIPALLTNESRIYLEIHLQKHQDDLYSNCVKCKECELSVLGYDVWMVL